MSSSSTASQRLGSPGGSGAEGAVGARPAARTAAAGTRPAAATAGEAPAGDGGAARGPARAPAAVRGPDAAAGPGPTTATADAGAPRQVRLTAARINPWSILKLSFLVSVALGVVLVVVVALLWTVLDRMGVFTDVNAVITEVVGSESSFDLMQVVGLSRVLSLAVVVAVVDVVLLTLLATLGAVLYNICSALVGGARLTLTDD